MEPNPLLHQQTWRWLESTKDLQQNTYGYPLEHFTELVRRDWKAQLDQVTKYLDWNVTAAVQELAEIREEFSWKPWATDEPFVNRERIIQEVVDVKHFLGNILVGIGCTDEEFEEAYQRKQDINRARAASGVYSAKKGGLSEGSD